MFGRSVIAEHVEVDEAQATLDQTQARELELRARMGKKEIRAPFRARVGLRNVHPGQYLGEGSLITTLQGVSDRIHVDFSLPQAHSRFVDPGAQIEVTAAGAPSIPAEVVAVDSLIDRGTRNVVVRVSVDNQSGLLRPGMYVDVRVPVGVQEDVVLVPATAVRRASYGDHVYVVAADETGAMRAAQRFVTIGSPIGPDMVVESGLEAGELEDRVAVDGDGARDIEPRRDTGPAPECRIEISPSQPSRTDYFLHVLTAEEATVDSVSPAMLEETDRVVVGMATLQVLISTADSALGQVSSLLNDIRGLVVEAANSGALSDEQIAANQLQVDSSLEALNRIAQTHVERMAREGVFLLLYIIPVYPIAGVIDLLIVNSIEFHSGTNPLSRGCCCTPITARIRPTQRTISTVLRFMPIWRFTLIRSR